MPKVYNKPIKDQPKGTVLGSSKIEGVKVNSFTKVEAGSFFGSAYIVFKVETKGLGWSVNRRYSDF